MSDLETLKDKIKKLSSRATARKMDLHDLSEDLPVNWQKIPQVAQEAFAAFQDLEAARKELKALEQQASA